MRYWWVNQNQTYRHEVAGGYLWSPKTKANGSRNPFYDTMTEVRAGDAIFSYCDTHIRAIGVAVGVAQTAAKPDEFGAAGAYWGQEGWLVPVRFAELKAPIRPKDHMATLGETLPEKYSPLQANGNGNQTIYLAAVPAPMARELGDLLGGQLESVLSASTLDQDLGRDDDRIEDELQRRSDVPETTKAQLIQARRGQGLFRARVELVEKGCRLTGVTAKTHLRASHIKPWRIATDREKLDGHNGLLLAPHVDHLFDRGLISFTSAGDLLVASAVPSDLMAAWGLPTQRNVGSFNPQQQSYLWFHREAIFRG